MYTTLIDTSELNQIIDHPDVRVIDCRFDLTDTIAGRRAFLKQHIDGAQYADLDNDLSGQKAEGLGRHPLPAVAQMVDTFSRLGIAETTQVIAYDDANGMIAARLWWMLRYLGHERAAVLNGGWQRWQTEAGACSSGEKSVARSEFKAVVRPHRLVRLEQLSSVSCLVDARASQRFRGEVEPLDPRAGHIPGAMNRHFLDNINDDGLFCTAAELRREFEETLGTLPDSDTVHMCGSGVSACHNILAQVHAGLPEPRLYCGSWSEWCADPKRPVALG